MWQFDRISRTPAWNFLNSGKEIFALSGCNLPEKLIK